MSLGIQNALVYLAEADAMTGALGYVVPSEHRKLSQAMTRAISRADDRTNELA